MLTRPWLLPALVALPSLAAGQDYHDSMQPVADYSQCVSERARAIEPKSASVENAILTAMTKCKGQRARALTATRARMNALGLPSSTVKQSSETMFTSMEGSMKENLRQELVKVRGTERPGLGDAGR